MLASAALMGSPGPVTISLVATSSVYGLRRSLRYLLGTIVGTMTVLVAVATGITVALLTVPVIGSVLIAISAGYILWLAYHVATAPPLTEQITSSGAPGFGGGALLGIANPKGWVAIAAVFASAHLAETATTDAIAKIAVLSLMIVVICVMWVVAGRSLAVLLRDPRRSRVVNVTLAVVLIGATAIAILH
ncbi:MAG TPA: LysE family translocator [Candidatus Saccharimonadales bacterium]|jgi:threonine/homoserine/homoserine lactone efflux protein|nr:LysE family translocator [Candidatus Saccharimonadales bacterium]